MMNLKNAPLYTLVLLVLLSVAGCEQTTDIECQKTDISLCVADDVPTARPEQKVGYDWRLQVEDSGGGGRVFLFYAQKDSGVDDAELKLLCLKGEGRVHAGVIVTDQFDELELRSNQQKLTLKASTNEKLMVSEEFASNSPFMHAFSKNGWMSMTVSALSSDGVRTGYQEDMASATADGARTIVDFVNYCKIEKIPSKPWWKLW